MLQKVDILTIGTFYIIILII